MARKPGELRELEPDTEKNILPTSIRMTHPGSYRVKNLIDEKLGWEGRPSSNFQITVKPDLAPLVQWVEPTERKLLVAPNDLLSFSALAQDDLGLARVEYLIKKTGVNGKHLPSPTCLTLVVKIQWQLTSTWTCFYTNLNREPKLCLN